jgi:hypothetical protein
MFEARLVCHGNGGHAKSLSDIGGFDGDAFAIVKIRCKRSGFGGFMLAKVDDAANCGSEWAC